MNKILLIVGLTVMVNLIFAQSNGAKLNENTSETKVKQIPWQMISTADESVPTPRETWGAVDTNSKSKQVSKPTTKNQPKLPAKNAKGKLTVKTNTKTKSQQYFIPPVLKEEQDSDTLKINQLGVNDSSPLINPGDNGEHYKSIVKVNDITSLKGEVPKNQVGEPFPAESNGGDVSYIESHSLEPIANPDVQARFPGGENMFYKYLRNTLVYPARCMDDGISGTVKLRFVVNVQGNISDIKVLEENKSCPEFTKEAIRVLRQSPKWVPAQVKGKFVNSWMMIPVRFDLE